MQNMGINKLANMFMGNPQPLAAKVEQAQQQTMPGQIPPDLEQAIALQKIQEMRQAAQNQQAMQAGGTQPTIVEKLRQMVQPQMQGQPQGMPPAAPQVGMPQGMPPQGLPQAMPQGGMQPVQAAHGGSIAHLMSNLGNNYGGGGIVAFAGEDGSYVDDPMRDLIRPNSAPALRTPAQIAAEKYLEQSVLTTPETERERALAEFNKAVPERDLSVYDRAAEELERRKQQMNAPATGMPALMEYLRQVAQAPKGVGSLTAGAMGAQKVHDLQKEREQQQFDLTKQILEQQQRKADTIRSDAKEKFGIGDAAYNAMFKRNLEAALKITSNELEAEKMAKQATDNQLNRDSNERMAEEKNKLQASANANTAAYHAADLALRGRQADLAELTKPTADDIIFNRLMGKVNQDPEIKGLAKRLDNDEPGSDTYRQTQKLMHSKMSIYFAQHPNLLPPLSKMEDMAEPLSKPKSFSKSFEEGFKELGDYGWYPGKDRSSKPAGTVSFDQLPK